TRLLRTLQSGKIRRVGGRQEIAVHVRIIAATNKDLGAMIGAGTFREDLFYRLNVVPIELPPLRERKDDIGELSLHFLAKAAEDGLPRRTLAKDAVKALSQRIWPGNVRELRNVIYRLSLISRDDEIDAAAVRSIIGDAAAKKDQSDEEGFYRALDQWLAINPVGKGVLYKQALAAFEKPLFEHALAETGGNQLRAAELLGINRNTLRKRLGELAINPDRFNGPL
ncbi:MAG TPA: nitrogen regulation protein NR(I), partial [Erythrobacter sp.]|nr:nitrogen regulation protein NR(I) [Erythrobacter sp.]